MQTFTQIFESTGLSMRDCAIVLGVDKDTVYKIITGRSFAGEGLLGDLVQIAEDIDYWAAYMKANPDALPHYKILKAAASKLEEPNV